MVRQCLNEASTSTSESMWAQGFGRINSLKAVKCAETYTPRVTLVPPSFHLEKDCPYLSPLCDQPLIRGGLPLSFNVTDDSEYISHENLSLVRVDSSGNNVFLKDLSVEGASHFGGELESSNYEFNITRFFNSYLNDETYTDELYILASGGVINANRTVIDNNSLLITILYSDL